MGFMTFDDIKVCPECGEEDWQGNHHENETFHDISAGEDGMYWNECVWCGAAVYEDGSWKS